MTEWVERSLTSAVPGKVGCLVAEKVLPFVLTQMRMLAVEMGEWRCWGKSYRKKPTWAPAQRQRVGREWRQKISPLPLMGTLWMLHSNGSQDMVPRPAAAASVENCLTVLIRTSWVASQSTISEALGVGTVMELGKCLWHGHRCENCHVKARDGFYISHFKLGSLKYFAFYVEITSYSLAKL